MTREEWGDTQERLVADVAYLRATVEIVLRNQSDMMGLIQTQAATNERQDQQLSKLAPGMAGGGMVALLIELARVLFWS